MQDLSVVLLAEGKITDAEQRMKDCLAFRQRVSPDDWQTFDAMSVLGGVLLQEKRFEEAEPLLLSGYSGIRARARKMTAEDQPRLARAAQRLAKLYTATDQPVKAAKWEKESEMSQRAAR
jgi:non-specific serine/threonine protein kinase/serine/threonine-protein kinase